MPLGRSAVMTSSTLASLIRLGWLVASAVALSDHLGSSNTQHCQVYDDATVFISVLLADLVIQSAFQLWIICISGRKGIYDDKRHRRMSRLVPLQLVLFVTEVAWIIVGSVWMFSGETSCDGTINKSRALVIVGYAWIVFYIIKQLCMADPAGCFCGHSPGDSELYWKKCCRVVCSCADVDNGDRGIILDIARMFSTAFANTGIARKMVAREYNRVHDVAAGDRPHSAGLSKQENPSMSLNFDDPQQQRQTQSLRDSSYYMKYALAAYGWPLVMFMNLGTGLCRLAPNCHCTCCRNHTTPTDNCLECQTGLNRDAHSRGLL